MRKVASAISRLIFVAFFFIGDELSIKTQKEDVIIVSPGFRNPSLRAWENECVSVRLVLTSTLIALACVLRV